MQTIYQWEAEDYNHDSGQFFDNPQVDSYDQLGSTPNVDNHQADIGGSTFQYRLIPRLQQRAPVTWAVNYPEQISPRAVEVESITASGITVWIMG